MQPRACFLVIHSYIKLVLPVVVARAARLGEVPVEVGEHEREIGRRVLAQGLEE